MIDGRFDPHFAEIFAGSATPTDRRNAPLDKPQDMHLLTVLPLALTLGLLVVFGLLVVP